MWSCQKIKSRHITYVGEVIVDTMTVSYESNHRGGNRWGYDFAGYSLVGLPYAGLVGCCPEYSHSFRISGVYGVRNWNAFTFTESPIQALISLVVFMIVQIVEGNVVYPKVVGSSVGFPTDSDPCCCVNRWKSLWFSRNDFLHTNFCRDLPFRERMGGET